MELAPVNSDPIRHLLANLRFLINRGLCRFPKKALCRFASPLLMNQFDQPAQLIGTGRR